MEKPQIPIIRDHEIFPYYQIPIYVSKVGGMIIEPMTEELNSAFDKVEWAETPHNKITQKHFASLALDEFECNSFLKEIDYHISQYMVSVGHQLGFEYFVSSSWFNKLEYKDCIPYTDYSTTDMVGIYVAAGTEGVIELSESHERAASSWWLAHVFGNKAALKITERQLILLPSWMKWQIFPNKTETDIDIVTFTIKFNSKKENTTEDKKEKL